MKGNEFISLGHITKAQGLKGAFRVRAHSVESENMLILQTLYVRSPSGHMQPFSVESIQKRKGFFVVTVKEITHIDQVAPLINLEVLADKNTFATLDDGDYYWYELVGLTVVTTSGRTLGVVQCIIPTGSNDVLQVKDLQNEYLIPYTDEVVCDVNLESGTILIESLPGLFD